MQLANSGRVPIKEVFQGLKQCNSLCFNKNMNYISVFSKHHPFRLLTQLSTHHTIMSDTFKYNQLIVNHIWNVFLQVHLKTLLITNGYGDYILVLIYKMGVLSIPERLWSSVRKQNEMDISQLACFQNVHSGNHAVQLFLTSSHSGLQQSKQSV